MQGSESSASHRKVAADQGPIPVGIVTVSDSRTEATDVNGAYLAREIESAGNRVVFRRIVPDEPAGIGAVLDAAVESGARIVLFNGGTGIAPRDTTFDVLSQRLEKTLPGFGEIFRLVSYQEIGAAAMLSRATAGVYRGVVIFSTPGSPHAVALAYTKLIAPEMAHLAWEVTRRF